MNINEDEKMEEIHRRIKGGHCLTRDEFNYLNDDSKLYYINKSHSYCGGPPMGMIWDDMSDVQRTFYLRLVVQFGEQLSIGEFESLNDKDKVNWFKKILKDNKHEIDHHIVEWFEERPEYRYLAMEYMGIEDDESNVGVKDERGIKDDKDEFEKYREQTKHYSQMSNRELDNELNDALDRKDYKKAEEIAPYLKINEQILRIKELMKSLLI